MKTMNLKNKIFMFWGCMDVLAILIYFFFSFYHENIPIYSDVKDFYIKYKSWSSNGWEGLYALILFVLGLLMQISLFYSAYALMIKKEVGVSFFCGQELLRLFSLTCSLTFLPYLLNFIDGYPWYLGISVFIFSETCKIGTCLWCKRLPVSKAVPN